jgi:hypothetical protein
MHNIYYIHKFDVYLLHVSVSVHRRQGEQLCQFFENPTNIMTLLYVGSILQLMFHEHEYTIKCTAVCVGAR